jgi:tetratricopeptide (TPR) repeat protein
MIKISGVIFVCLIALSCSGQKEVVKKEQTKKIISVKADSDFKDEALEHFINGSTAEAKGDYATAILEFQDAIRLDKSSGIYYALAKNYFYLNKLSLALENARKAVDLDSTQDDYYDLLSDIYTSGNQLDSAEVVLNKLITIDSTNINAYYKLARLYEPSKPMKAVEIYNKITSLIGPDWNVLIHVADLEEKLGNIDKAENSLEELMKLDPGNSSLQKMAVEFYIRNKKYDKALELVNDIIELTPDDLEAREKKAQIYIAEGDWKEASKEYSYILNQPDVPFDVKIRISAVYFNQSLKDSTLLPTTKKLFETIDKDTTDWQVKMYLGAIAINEKQDSVAIENFKQVTELAKWNVDGWIRLGGLYYDNKKYDEAAKIMKEAIVSFPEDFTVNLILGLSLSQENNNAEAKEYLKKAVDLNSSDINALSAYAFTLNQLKNYSEAVKYLNKALAIKPDDVNLLGTLGLIYDNQGQHALSDSVYESALKIDSTNALINNNYAYALSERGLQLERALKMVNIALLAEPKNSSYLDTKGWIYFKMAKYKMAKDFIEKAIDAGGESAVMLEHLGDIVYKIGEQDYAKKLWEKALKLDVTNSELKQKIEKGEI